MAYRFSSLLHIMPDDLSSDIDSLTEKNLFLKASIAQERIRYNNSALEQRLGIFIHSLLLTKNGAAFLFLGSGGAGKSTLGRKMHPFFTLGNDDCNFLLFSTHEDTRIRAFSTPFYTVKNAPPPLMNDTSGILQRAFVLEQEKESPSHIGNEVDKDRIWDLLMGSPIALPYTSGKLYPVMNEMVSCFIDSFSFSIFRHNLIDPPEQVAAIIASSSPR